MNEPHTLADRAIAEQIAAELFVNGSGEKARRLVLELEDGRNGGGWCKEAIVDRVADAIERLTAEREAALTLIRGLSKRIEREAEHGSWLPDHACAECAPHSEILRDGFRCYRHRALALTHEPRTLGGA
jgi:hypothetical protein